MTYKGHIKNGAVILNDSVQLPEGTEVTVEITDTAQVAPLSDVLRHAIGKAQGLPPDASTQKRHYLYGHPKS